MPKSSQLKHYWTLKRQQKFLFRFSQLLEQGLSLSTSLEIMATLFKQEMIQVITDACAKGQSLATTLETCFFEKRIIYIIRCCEEAGSLLQGLQKAAEYSLYRLTSKQELNKKLRYPMTLFIVMILILTGVYFFFFPQLENFYQSFNIEGDHHLLNQVFLILGSVITFIIFFIFFSLLVLKWKYTPFQRWIKTWLFKIPLLNQLAQKIFAYYFSNQWFIFLNCGLPLKDSLLMMKEFENIPFIKMIIHEFESKLEAGTSLESVLCDNNYFPLYFKLVLKHALQIGAIHQELQIYTKTELEQLTIILNNAFKLIQFIFLGLIGIIIVLIYLSLLQPVFELTQLL